MKNIYESGKYIKLNPNYHVEDSKFKANNFIKILKKNKISNDEIKTIVDLGCGSGDIIKFLKKKKFFNTNTKFYGFDINQDAIDLAKDKEAEDLIFSNENFFENELNGNTDLIICADVYEHVEDYISFLKKMVHAGKFFLFNIPLDISVRSILNRKQIPQSYKNFGHVHFFNKNITKLMLRHCDFEIIDTIYAKNFLDHLKKDSLKRMIYFLPVMLFDMISEDLSANLFGGYSLVVLAKKK